MQYRMHPELPLGQTGDWKSEEARKADWGPGPAASQQTARRQLLASNGRRHKKKVISFYF